MMLETNTNEKAQMSSIQPQCKVTGLLQSVTLLSIYHGLSEKLDITTNQIFCLDPGCKVKLIMEIIGPMQEKSYTTRCG